MTTKINQSGIVTAVDKHDDGTTSVTIASRKVDNGVPSFIVTYAYPAGSPAAERYPLDTVWIAAIEINAPAQDQVTSTASLTSASGVTEAPVEPATGIVPEAPVEDSDGPPLVTFQTPASDIPEADLTPQAPAVVDPRMANADINTVKEQLGIA